MTNYHKNHIDVMQFCYLSLALAPDPHDDFFEGGGHFFASAPGNENHATVPETLQHVTLTGIV